MGIKVCDLVMEYKKGVKVLNHVNLTIEHGIYGLLGENGAGKTTLMKILVTLLTPTSGTVEINGLTVKPENYEIIKKQIGYLPQEFGLYPNLTVREALEYPDALRSGRYAPCAGGRVHEAPIAKQTDPGHPEQPIRKRRTRRPVGPAPGVFLWGIWGNGKTGNYPVLSGYGSEHGFNYNHRPMRWWSAI